MICFVCGAIRARRQGEAKTGSVERNASCAALLWKRCATVVESHAAKMKSLDFNRIESFVDRRFFRIFPLILLANLNLATFVIKRVHYTEIDWVAYMQEVAGVVERGELDYHRLGGDTGPLVYPAGFVYVYSALYYVTNGGKDIRLAQYTFAILHTLTLLLVTYIYRRCYRNQDGSKLFPLAIVFCSLFLSRRAMSLFVLRLFNDGVQMLIMYATIAMFIEQRWSLGCILYSISVSVKMNALLFAPGVAVLLCQAKGFRGALRRIIWLCFFPQVLLGAPFLRHAPMSYISRAFEVTRVFKHKWSVNGAFLSESAFIDKRWAASLLLAHVWALLLFGHFLWTEKNTLGLFGLIGMKSNKEGTRFVWTPRARSLRAQHIVTVLFSCNFIGICFARTLHYQFYLWYAHSIPFLVCIADLPVTLKVLLPIVIEVVFNVYPPRMVSAIVLNIAHTIIFAGLARRKQADCNTIYITSGGRKAGNATMTVCKDTTE